MKWVTRERPKIDRLACPWLIRRFIDPQAEILYVPTPRVLDVAQEQGAIPFDVPGVELTHDGPLCSFDAFLKKYQLEDQGLAYLAEIVRAADTDTLERSREAPGLLAISLGLGANIADDHKLLEAASLGVRRPVYLVSFAPERASRLVPRKGPGRDETDGSMMRALLVLLCASATLVPATVIAGSLQPVGTIELPGPKGQRFDYLTVDSDDHYLLSAHLGPGLLYVIDVRTNSLVKAISGVPGITGVEYVPGVRKVYTSNWGEEKIGVIDLKQMKVVKRLPTGEKPNGSVFAAGFGKVYVSNTNGKAMSIVNVETDEIVKTLEFGSETGMPQYDPIAKRVYVNLRSTNEVAAIDPATDTVVERYAVEGCRFNHGMAVDSAHHRAFLLCGGNRTLTVLALDTHQALAHFPLPQGADVVKFDPGLGRAYAACSSGFISIVQEDDATHFRKLEDFPVQKLVHSLAIDPDTHRVYAPEQEADGMPASRIVIYEPVSLRGS